MSEQKTEQVFNIDKIYTKDISFESPNAPAIFSNSEWKPEINVQLNTNHTTVGDDVYEVVLKLTVTAKQGETTAFLVEVQQAGVFTIKGFAQEQLNGMLGAYCSESLFPFAREAIASLVANGGFPQLILAPVNFNALYQQHMQQQAATAEGTAH